MALKLCQLWSDPYKLLTKKILSNVEKLEQKLQHDNEINKHVQSCLSTALSCYDSDVRNMRKSGRISRKRKKNILNTINRVKEKVNNRPISSHSDDSNTNVSLDEKELLNLAEELKRDIDENKLKEETKNINHKALIASNYKHERIVHMMLIFELYLLKDNLFESKSKVKSLNKGQETALAPQNFRKPIKETDGDVSSYDNVSVENDKSEEDFSPSYQPQSDIEGTIEDLQRIEEKTFATEGTIELLEDIEEKTFATVESTIILKDKLNSLDEAYSKTSNLFTNNPNVQQARTKLMNKIYAYIILETMNYMRELKQNVDHYKEYAQQFPYPISLDVYEKRKDEIESLKYSLNQLLRDEECINDRKNWLIQEVDEALQMLEDKANFNESIVTQLEALDNINHKITRIKENSPIPRVNKLEHFVLIHDEVASIGDHHIRLCLKKEEVLQNLHQVENSSCYSKYPQLIKKNKEELDKYEINFQQCMNENSWNAVLKLKENIEAIKNQIDNNEMDAIIRTFDIVCKYMMNKASEMQRINQQLMKLETIDLSQLKKYRKDASKLTVCLQKEVLSKIEECQFKCKTSKFTRKLEEFKNEFETLRQEIEILHHPISTKYFQKTLDTIFKIKERVEDVPDENDELYSQKESVRKESSALLLALDKELGQVIISKKPPENILELQGHFSNFDPNKLERARDSIKFVEKIKLHAESFENCVDKYFGTSDSTDYYVIRESLMRLLEELDLVMCKDDKPLLKKVVGTMEYIKRLIRKLEENGGEEDE